MFEKGTGDQGQLLKMEDFDFFWKDLVFPSEISSYVINFCRPL